MDNQNRDALTGLGNRKYGLEQLELAVENCAQVALLFIDVDRMKTFNCSLGHLPGDEAIIQIAREIEAESGANSVSSRFGGDEFVVILPENSLEQAREVAERIRAQREEVGVEIEGKKVATLTLSIGIAHFPTHVSSAQHLLEAADLAMWKAKGQQGSSRLPDGTPYTGRNRVMAIGDFWDDFPEQSAAFLK